VVKIRFVDYLGHRNHLDSLERRGYSLTVLASPSAESRREMILDTEDVLP
jgi:hypothetical protein